MMDPLSKVSRLISLDVFRGLTVFLMILVNSPGNNVAYTWLEHSAWNGCTLADLVFPFFLFIVGVSLVFGLYKNRGSKRPALLIFKILKRTLFIFSLGLLLNFYSAHFEWEQIRYFGVLQRIAVCYGAAALLFLTCTMRTQIIITGGILLTYWLIYLLFPDLTLANNPAAYVDRWFFSSQHLYGKVYDPEGILSTLPALATTLIGVCIGYWLICITNEKDKLTGLVLFGVCQLVLGWLWSFSFPFNKALWTSSYVLWTAGMATLLLATLYWLIEIKSWRFWTAGFILLGTNAMLAYVLHVFFLKLQSRIYLYPDVNLKNHLTNQLFGWASPLNASLFYALSYTVFWIIVLSTYIQIKVGWCRQPYKRC